MFRTRRPEAPVTDADRERAADLLGAHMVGGAITPEQLAERTNVVLSAETRADLARALEGLPALPPRPLLVRAAQRISLRTHVIAYVAVSAVLVGVWAFTRITGVSTIDEGFRLLWPFWIMLGWGVVLVAHALYALRQPLLLRARRRVRRRQAGGRAR